jgi:hypothetical protein
MATSADSPRREEPLPAGAAAPEAGGRKRRRPPRAVLLGLAALGVLAGAALVLAQALVPGGLGGLAPWAPRAPAYREVVHAVSQPVLGRDFVIAPGDAKPERIEWVVATIAAEERAPLLRINIFTSEAAARRRRELIAAGVYARDEEEPDPPEWAEVNREWVGVYTRDPFSTVHQLSICLGDPTHARCEVRRYSSVMQ